MHFDDGGLHGLRSGRRKYCDGDGHGHLRSREPRLHLLSRRRNDPVPLFGSAATRARRSTPTGSGLQPRGYDIPVILRGHGYTISGRRWHRLWRPWIWSRNDRPSDRWVEFARRRRNNRWRALPRPLSLSAFTRIFTWRWLVPLRKLSASWGKHRGRNYSSSNSFRALLGTACSYISMSSMNVAI